MHFLQKKIIKWELASHIVNNKKASDARVKKVTVRTQPCTVCVCTHSTLHTETCPCVSRKKRKIQRQKLEESWHQRTTEATALRGHFIALLWSSEVHRAQFHHNNGKEGRRDKRGLSLLLNPFSTGRSVAWGTERTTPGHLRSGEGGITNSQSQLTVWQQHTHCKNDTCRQTS